MPAQVHADGHIITIECRARSHESKPAVLATFQEMLFDNGRRANIDLRSVARYTRDGVMLIKHARADVEIGPGSDGRIVRDSRPSPVVESPIRAGDDVPFDPEQNPESEVGRWHYQIRCPLCDFNLSARSESLRPVLGKLIDGGVSRIDLARLGAILDLY